MVLLLLKVRFRKWNLKYNENIPNGSRVMDRMSQTDHELNTMKEEVGEKKYVRQICHIYKRQLLITYSTHENILNCSRLILARWTG